MKRRMPPISTVVEMNSNAVGLTDVLRRSRTAVSAAVRMGHSSNNPSTLIQAVMSSIASTSAASRASRGVPASRCFSSLRSQRPEAAASVGADTMQIGQRRHELIRDEQADVLVQHRPAHFERHREVVIHEERVGRHSRVEFSWRRCTLRGRARPARGPAFETRVADARSRIGFAVNVLNYASAPR